MKSVYLLLWFTKFAIFVSCEVVFINFTSPNEILFKINKNLVQLNIPVVIQQSQQNESTITCSLNSTNSNSSTDGTFNSVILTPTNTTGVVTFSCSKAGREVLFSCHKQNDVNTHGNVGWIQCTKPPVVNIVPQKMQILLRTVPFNQTFLLKLSERVQTYPVEVKCALVASSNLSIGQVQTTVNSGFITKLISIEITSAGKNSKATITCTGQSIGGFQYQNSTSMGSSSDLLIVGGQLKLIPRVINIYNTKTELLLYANGLLEDINIICGVKVATSDAEIETLQSVSTCTATNDSAAGMWKIKPTNVAFKASTASQQLQTLRVYRSTYPSESEENNLEMLFVRCCNPVMSSENDPAFAGTAVFARINVLLRKPFLMQSGDEFPTETETVLPNPAFTNIAPCPCDLTPRVCDMGCCCDPACPSEQAVRCFPYPFGGGSISANPSNCTAAKSLFNSTTRTFQQYSGPNGTQQNPVRLSELHKFLCTTIDNNAALGHYYTSLEIARNQSMLEDYLASRGQKNAIVQSKDDGSRSVLESGSTLTGTYQEGDALRLISEIVGLAGTDSLSLSDSSEKPVLTLPDAQNCYLPSGSAIRFLREMKPYQCAIEITMEACNAASTLASAFDPGQSLLTLESRLSGKAYLIGHDVSARLPPPVYELLANRFANSTRTPTKVNYYCLTDPEVTRFTSVANNSETTESDLGFFNQDCVYNSTTGSTNCTNLAANQMSGSRLGGDCLWDDGFALAPDVNLTNGICNNVVLKVDYRFYWSGGSIPRAEADIYFGNIETTRAQVYYQSFSASFIPASISTTVAAGTVPTSSGVYGYDLGALLITGRLQSSSTSNTFSVVVDDPSSPGVTVIKPGLNGLCGNAGRDAIRFDESVASGCRVNLGVRDFENCAKLRSLVQAQMNQYVTSDVIAVYGGSSATVSSDWVRIQRAEDHMLQNETLNSPINITLVDNGIATTVDLKGICKHIPATIQLDIFYAKQGKILNQPILQIVGAQVKYDYVDWQLTCASSEYPSVCRSSTAVMNSSAPVLSQAFYIQTEVNFHEVPRDWSWKVAQSANASRMHELLMAETHACPYDACWHEAFYAWTIYPDYVKSARGLQVAYQVAISLGLGAIVLGMLIITKPLV